MKEDKSKKIENQTRNNTLVAVRCRPLNNRESSFSNIETIQIKGKDLVTVIDPIEYEGISISKNRNKEQNYAFDIAFSKNTSQEEVYQQTTQYLIKDVIEGFNATVFAYGASGAGKTYTMVGHNDQPGIMVRTVSDLFNEIENVDHKDYRIKINYIEIYNETIRDLLSDDNEILDLREDPNKGVSIVGVKDIPVLSAADVFKLLIKGNKNRTEEATVYNEVSSRSHGVLQVIIETNDRVMGLANEVSVGKFILVDLAGSERVSGMKNNNVKILESGNINKSLLALGNCINALADPKGVKTFIPWRDSKLTRILKDSLSGNSRIVMIANISPSIISIEETINTLKYANRAKNIKVNIKKNIIEKDYHISKYDEVVSSMKNEIEYLKQQLDNKTQIINIKNNEPQSNTEEIQKIINDINNHFDSEVNLRRDIIDTEKLLESNKYELSEKEYELYKSNNKDLKTIISNLNNENEKLSKILNEKYMKQSELMKKRTDLQNLIKKYKKDYLSHILNKTYQYYISILDNMTLEHRKNININYIKIKEIQLNKLVDQIKKRDDYINKADTELKKKMIKVKSNENIIPLDDIINEPIKLPLIGISQNDNSVFLNNSQTNPVLKNIKKLRDTTPHRTYDYEISVLSKNSSNKRLHNKKIFSTPKIKEKDTINSSHISNTSISRIEKDMEKKKKTILRKNIVGRYKNSPYINKI